MKVPKTKDGKHELIFPQEFIDNHGISVRGAYEGRRIWEVCNLPISEVRRLTDKYPKFRSSYDAIDDPEGLFSDISLPHTGTVVFSEMDEERPMGNKFTNPIIPITHSIDDKGKYWPGYSKLFGPDSSNAKGRWSTVLEGMVPDSRDRYPEIKKHERLIKVENHNEELHKYYAASENLENVLTDKESRRFLESTAHLLVWLMKIEAEHILNNPEHYRYKYFYNHVLTPTPLGKTIVHCSATLSKKVVEASIALADEYIAEMGRER